MTRGYQENLSEQSPALLDRGIRERKAATMICVFKDVFDEPLEGLKLLNIGGSGGIIDHYLAQHFRSVTSVDIDEKAIEFAKQNFSQENLLFEVGDAMDLKYSSDSFDAIVCSQVYEHVPDATILAQEMLRVLRPGGFVFFAAGNRLAIKEPHYHLPFLSVIPRPLAHLYLRLCGKGTHYYEKHFTYWGLKRLVNQFQIVDYTQRTLADPVKYQIAYMVQPESKKQKIALFVAKYFMWLVPGYIWLLRKP